MLPAQLLHCPGSNLPIPKDGNDLLFGKSLLHHDPFRAAILYHPAGTFSGSGQIGPWRVGRPLNSTSDDHSVDFRAPGVRLLTDSWHSAYVKSVLINFDEVDDMSRLFQLCFLWTSVFVLGCASQSSPVSDNAQNGSQSAPNPSAAPDPRYARLCATAKEDLAAGDNYFASTYAQSAVGVDSSRSQAYLLGAAANFRMGGLAEAKILLDRAVALDSACAHDPLAVEINPSDPQAASTSLSTQAQQYESEAAFARAADAYMHAWRLQPGRGEFGLKALASYQRSGDIGGALRIARALSASLDPEIASKGQDAVAKLEADAKPRYAKLLAQADQHGLEQALELFPNRSDSHVAIAVFEAGRAFKYDDGGADRVVSALRAAAKLGFNRTEELTREPGHFSEMYRSQKFIQFVSDAFGSGVAGPLVEKRRARVEELTKNWVGVWEFAPSLGNVLENNGSITISLSDELFPIVKGQYSYREANSGDVFDHFGQPRQEGIYSGRIDSGDFVKIALLGENEKLEAIGLKGAFSHAGHVEFDIPVDGNSAIVFLRGDRDNTLALIFADYEHQYIDTDTWNMKSQVQAGSFCIRRKG